MRAAEIRARLSQPWRHGEAADFTGLTVVEPLDLSGLPLCGVDFSGTVFRAGINARGARFDGLSWFFRAQFGGPVDFSGARFANDARFDGAVFGADARFTGAVFQGTASFPRVRFSGDADLDALTCYGNADLAEAQFARAMTLSGSEFLGGIWAQDSLLPAEAELRDTQVHGRLWLRGARRGNRALGEADFGLTFGYTYL